MDEFLDLDPKAVCISVHPALEYPCPVCGAEPSEPCLEEQDELPLWAAHIGRATQGDTVTVEPTGDGAFRAVDN
jgi:hypothetical protein